MWSGEDPTEQEIAERHCKWILTLKKLSGASVEEMLELMSAQVMPNPSPLDIPMKNSKIV